jgi:hypothetical protein
MRNCFCYTYIAIDIKYLIEVGIRRRSLSQRTCAQAEEKKRDSARRHDEDRVATWAMKIDYE